VTDLRGAKSTVGGALSLRSRPAAAPAIATCLNAQTESRPRSIVGRTFGMSPLSEVSRRPYVEALGELRVADELAKLGPAWAVLHEVPVGERGQVIDHLVIGPAGVFAIDVVHRPADVIAVHGDTLTVNGAGRPHLALCRDLATDAAMGLTRATGINVPVRGLIVFVAPGALSVRDEPDDIGVTSDRAVSKWLASRAHVLDAATVEVITDAAAAPSTWRGAALPRTPGFDADAFDALRVEVQRAWLARGLWGAAIIAAAAIAAPQVF